MAKSLDQFAFKTSHAYCTLFHRVNLNRDVDLSQCSHGHATQAPLQTLVSTPINVEPLPLKQWNLVKCCIPLVWQMMASAVRTHWRPQKVFQGWGQRGRGAASVEWSGQW